MLTPKEALVKDGRVTVKEGRGRMSAEAVSRVKELVAEGWDIKGYAKQQPTTNATETQSVKVVKVSTNGQAIADLPPLRYDETMWQAVSEVPVFGSTVFGMREVCWFCGSSLSYHTCDTPIVHGVSVKIVSK